jgi:hypothetical protein
MNYFCGEKEILFLKCSISHTALIDKNYILICWEGSMTEIF